MHLLNILPYFSLINYNSIIFFSFHLNFKMSCSLQFFSEDPNLIVFFPNYAVLVLEGLAHTQNQRDSFFLIPFSQCLLLPTLLVANCSHRPDVESMK